MRLSRTSSSLAPVNVQQSRTLIVSIQWNKETLLREYWNAAVLALVRHLGPANVFVSVYESGSWDGTKDALRALERELSDIDVGNLFVLDERTHADEVAAVPGLQDWIITPAARKELRRIPYLSRLRNLSLKPIRILAARNITFDRILFLNDIIFTIQDVENLFNTRNGAFAAACALDFEESQSLYDTFATRDSEGHEPLMLRWPYFRSAVSRTAIKRNEPVPVTSCWNGMVIMRAAPFYGLSEDTTPLRFRGVPDSLADFHLEGSECCLIHQDNPSSSTEGVFINPDVRVSYSKVTYDQDDHNRLDLMTYLTRCWENRLRRWFTTSLFARAMVRLRVQRWSKKSSEQISRSDLVCLINEMQILKENGWAHE